MQIFHGWRERLGLAARGFAMAGKKNPWGGGSDGGDDGGDRGDGPRNPWLPGGGSGDAGKRRSASIDDIFKNRGPEGPRRSGGGGGPTFRIPDRPGGKSWLPIVLSVIAVLWFGATSVHFVQPGEQAVVTWLGGKYSTTFDSGTNLSFPYPMQMVEKDNVTKIRSETVPTNTDQEKLILTRDQNLVDLSYVIRWNIADLTLYKYQLAEPRNALMEIGEATMRAAVAKKNLDVVLTGAGRAEIEQEVREKMQARLDSYRAGITVQGIEINKTDPPARVEEAFKDVSSARQDADAEINRSRAFAQRLLAQAQGDASEFNNIYAEYRLAPEVTRRRLYYETMEAVLSKTDKTIVEGSGSVTPFLPLPELQRRARESAAQATTPKGGQ